MSVARIKIRAFLPADAAAILEIQRLAAEAAPWRLADYERLAQDPDGQVLAAELPEGGGIAGFLAARLMGEEAELQNLAVHPGYRRRGVAKTLMERFHRRLTAAGVKRVYAEVRASNQPALSLYQSLGYTECGVRQSYYASDGEDAVVLQCELH